MFTRQIAQNLKSATVKITGIPKNPSMFWSVILTGDLASKSLLLVRHTKTLAGKFGKITDPKIRGI